MPLDTGATAVATDTGLVPLTLVVAGPAGNKDGRSVFTGRIHPKQIYQRIGSLNVETSSVLKYLEYSNDRPGHHPPISREVREEQPTD